MIKKIIYIACTLLICVQNIKSQQDPLIGKRLFQGNFDLNLNGEKQRENPGRDLYKFNNTNFSTNGLFGKIGGQKVAFTFGFNVAYTSETYTFFNFALQGKDIIEKSYRLKIGPSFGSTKFITISDNLFFVPSTVVNFYGTVGRDTNNAFRITGSIPFSTTNQPFIESARTLGAGIALTAIPLRIGYLWKNKILLTTSIGNIGAKVELENTKYKTLRTRSFQNNTIVVEELKYASPTYNIALFGSLINTASFGVTYLF